ncbi:calcium/manganese antiporter SLC30A10 isoform X2 [Pteronotus mesoamericanus]|uniref:calcium/manganese antiporter SLC30A10 isoform X2 n=1 Tax=Pteronotus mesoamericanus TaxID=1884717 RepID=UPI0023ED5F30|nr:zinc transporter 10 isoform X2 [Pteronotus parnellii mesoamericanus]
MGRYSGRSFRLVFMCVVSVLLFVMELAVAHIGNSLSLASDAFAVLSHLLSMIIGLFGLRASHITRHERSTFGFLRADVVGAFGNSIFAVALMFSILVEAIKRFIDPQKTEAAGLVLSAGIIGLFFNVLNYVILDCCYCSAHGPQPGAGTGDPLNIQNEPEETMKKEKKSEALNIRGVLLHVMGDALGSVVVVITAIIFYVLPLNEDEHCNWQCYIDPSLTVAMVAIILSSAFPLIKETAAILLQMVPKGVNVEELLSKLSAVPGVSSVHEVHVWELVSGKIIATLHIKCQKDRGYADTSAKIREIFHHAGVHNVTIQFESVDVQEPPEQKDMLSLCSSPCISEACAKHLCCPPRALPLAHVNGFAEHNGCPPRDLYRSEGLGGGEVREAAIEVPLDSCVSAHGRQDFTKTQEDLCYSNSTYF